MKKLLLLIILTGFIACKKNENRPNTAKVDSTLKNTVEKDSSTQIIPNKEENLRKLNDEILSALKNKDYKKFAEFIHPEKGIRFSMYAFISVNEDKHFSKSDFIQYQPKKTVFTWGARDGSGELYKASLSQYLKDWVFVKDFTQSQYSLNTFQGGGNSLNNVKEIYPGTDFTENYLKSADKSNEMDWHTLRFVFQQWDGQYYLIAVINDRWTI